MVTVLCNDVTRYMLQDLRNGFEAEAAATGRETLLLTAAVAAGYSTVSNGYDIRALNQ